MSDSDIFEPKDKLNLSVMSDHAAIAKAAALRIAQRLKEKPDLVLGLATGATMEPVYAELVRMHEKEGLDFSKARFFNLDHYKGLESTNRNSYDFQLRELFLKKVKAREENINLVQGFNFDPAAYERKIKDAGGIDIQLLGIGGEGHIGFNEVGSARDSRTREVTLSARTKEDNGTYFNRPGEKVPDAAYTMGIGTILEAKEIIALANNQNKAWAVRNLMEPTGKVSEELSTLELRQMQQLTKAATGNPMPIADVDAFFEARQADGKRDAKPVEDLPARALHDHPHVTLLVDEEAASMTRPSHLLQRSNLKFGAVEALLSKFSAQELRLDDGKKLFIPAGFDFYDPEVMGLDEKFDLKNGRHVQALQRVLQHATDVSVGAHQDDVEIMAGPMMLDTVKAPNKQWLSVIVTDGAASKSVLNGCATELSPKQLTDMRQLEQRKAAKLANAPVIQLKYPSATVNGHMGVGKKNEAAYALGTLFAATPNVERVFGHNPLDKHPTHIAVFAAQTAALRAAKPPKLEKAYGMEVWGGLTGLPESMLSVFEVGNDHLVKLQQIIEVFQSQILGQGRDYATGTIARIRGHGAYVSSPHLPNPPAGMVIGIDVTDFTRGQSHDMGGLAESLLQRARDLKVKVAEQHSVAETPMLANGYASSVLSGRKLVRQL